MLNTVKSVKSSESQLNLAFFSQKGHLRNHQSQNVQNVNRLTSIEIWNDKENDDNLKPRGRSCPPPLSEKNFKKVLAPPETTQRQLCHFFSIQNTASWIVTGTSLFSLFFLKCARSLEPFLILSSHLFFFSLNNFFHTNTELHLKNSTQRKSYILPCIIICCILKFLLGTTCFVFENLDLTFSSFGWKEWECFYSISQVSILQTHTWTLEIHYWCYFNLKILEMPLGLSKF